MIDLTLKSSETEELFTRMNSKNLSLMDNLKKVNGVDGKEKKKSSRFEVDLEERLKDSQKHIMPTFHKN